MGVDLTMIDCYFFRNRIFASPLSEVVPQEVVNYGELYVSGIAVDAYRQRLYFTGRNTSHAGIIARVSVSRHGNKHDTVFNNRYNPHAILFLPEERYSCIGI